MIGNILDRHFRFATAKDLKRFDDLSPLLPYCFKPVKRKLYHTKQPQQRVRGGGIRDRVSW